ncbi:hypothetical protein QQX98_000943 [Neonectria punicea]|uniref:Xaa-Pro dipeptidyl-peptidase C-terminal domain-containing protein n=1 Tax=Neonectria punicea TaxID=979145 RepID=A0ABR1HR49_9HYPO
MAVPAIISGGPYGKNGGYFSEFTDNAPWRFGIPRKTVSGLEKFEGLDPAYWCLHGYAIVHTDPRGVQYSDGDMVMTSKQDGEDNYDIIEWIASQVSMAGNSWLTQTQWFAAAEKPPHLNCLAPAEGWTDFYNDTLVRGGIPSSPTRQWIAHTATRGQNKVENFPLMATKYPFWNQYWDDRRAKLSNINIPVYIVASWTSMLHTGGTFHGWLGVNSIMKWLRVHNSNEWPDFYQPHNVEELRKFFVHYLKDDNNGWEFTPKVRLCILNHGGKDIINRPETDFPLSRQQTKTLYLDALSGSLKWDVPAPSDSSVRFDAQTGSAEFIYVFHRRVELTGYFTLELYVEAIGTNDVDIFCAMNKLSPDGTVLRHLDIDPGYLQDDPEAEQSKLLDNPNMHLAGIFFSEGPHGRLRASHRELSEESTLHDPRYTQRASQPLGHGEIVKLCIEMRPFGIIFEAGQSLRLTISGRPVHPELPSLPPPETINEREIVIHTGGRYQSALIVPFIE